MRAVVISIHPTQTFCHVESDQGRIFCHQNDCNFVLGDLERHDILDIGDIEPTPKGPRGHAVSFIERPPAPPRVFGRVTGINARGFAFLMTDDGQSLFCPMRDFADWHDGVSATFDALEMGDRLSCEVVPSQPKPRGMQMQAA